MGEVPIRGLPAERAAECESILRSLPDWFGIEQAIVEYRNDIESMPSLMAEKDGRILGFLTVRRHTPFAAEIQVMAVRRELHGKGLGRRLVEHAERQLREEGVEYLQVKTLGPSRENAEYARTRVFYEALGFRALQETTAFWGPVNPCLILIKRL